MKTARRLAILVALVTAAACNSTITAPDLPSAADAIRVDSGYSGSGH